MLYLQSFPAYICYLILLQSLISSVHQVSNTSAPTVLHYYLPTHVTFHISQSQNTKVQLTGKKKQIIWIQVSATSFDIETKRSNLPKGILLPGSFQDSGQHSDDYIAATSQSHHKSLHIPPPKKQKPL